MHFLCNLHEGTRLAFILISLSPSQPCNRHKTYNIAFTSSIVCSHWQGFFPRLYMLNVNEYWNRFNKVRANYTLSGSLINDLTILLKVDTVTGALFLYYILSQFKYTPLLFHHCLLFGEGRICWHTTPGPTQPSTLSTAKAWGCPLFFFLREPF